MQKILCQMNTHWRNNLTYFMINFNIMSTVYVNCVLMCKMLLTIYITLTRASSHYSFSINPSTLIPSCYRGSLWALVSAYLLQRFPSPIISNTSHVVCTKVCHCVHTEFVNARVQVRKFSPGTSINSITPNLCDKVLNRSQIILYISF